MSNKKQTDSVQEMSDSSVKEILFAEENPSKKPKKPKLTTSSAQVSGSGSLGETRKVIPTPPDATALVRCTEKGKLGFDTKAIAQENKTLKADVGILQDEIIALRSQLEEQRKELSKSPRSQPEPSPAKDLFPEGLDKVLCKSQLDILCDFVADKCTQAVLSGKEVTSPVPSLPSEAPGPSRVVSSQIGSTGKSVANPSPKDILGSSLGDGSEGDQDDFDILDGGESDQVG